MKAAVKKQYILHFLLFCVIAVPLFIAPKPFISGVSDGLNLSAGIFIPSMLPFYFLTAFLTKSGAGVVFSRLLSPLTRFLRLPEASAPVILTGMLGGYPAGAMSASDLYEKNIIDSETARRLMLFCVNAGPGFIIYSVGARMAGSIAAGFVLFASLIAGAFTSALLTRPKKGLQSAVPVKNIPRQNAASAFSESVSSAASACLAGSAAISLFGGITGFIYFIIRRFVNTSAIITSSINAAVSCVFEVTGGCAALSVYGGGLKLPLLAAVMGFGGLCVMVQLLNFCSGFIGFKDILFSRLLHGGISFLYALAFSRLFGVGARPREAMETVAALRRGQVPTAVVLLFFSFVLCVCSRLNQDQDGVAKKARRHYTKK